jgi:hypothetical protein
MVASGWGFLQLDTSGSIPERDRERFAEPLELIQVAVVPELPQVGDRILLRLGPQALASDVGAHCRQDRHAKHAGPQHQKVAREQWPDSAEQTHSPIVFDQTEEFDPEACMVCRTVLSASSRRFAGNRPALDRT